MAFYLAKDNMYAIDMTSIEPTDTRMLKYIEDFKEEYDINHNEEINNTNRYVTAKNDFVRDYNQFKADLSELRIPTDEFDLYLKKAVIGKNIQKYFTIKETLKYAIIPILHAGDRIDRDSYHDYTENTTSTTTKSDITILNHRNPFADITIENQEFLYPDTDGKYQTLQFNVGYTMSKIEDENSAAIVMQPDFKITKKLDRNTVENTITMDDTITTPMPDSQGDMELLYI